MNDTVNEKKEKKLLFFSFSSFSSSFSFSSSSASASVSLGINPYKMEEVLWQHCEAGDDPSVRQFLLDNPFANVNWGNPARDGLTSLHVCCLNGHPTILRLLVTHPDIEVNQKDGHGNTPFMLGCAAGHAPCVRQLLQDERVAVNEPNEDGVTPLAAAAGHEHLEAMTWIIASGRMLKEEEGQLRDPQERAAEIFVPVVLLCDGLLALRDLSTTPRVEAEEKKEEEEEAEAEEDRNLKERDAARFFRIASELPMELQMVLCHRAVSSAKTNISQIVFEDVLKEFVRSLHS